jgi:hypothetical protein
MSETKPQPKAGEPCPQCGAPFRKATVPTEEQRAAATNRENPTVLPPNSDTATKEQIEKLGVLHTCLGCNYQTRIKDEDTRAPRQLEGAVEPAIETHTDNADPRDAEIARLKGELAQRETPPADPRDAEIARLKAELATGDQAPAPAK